MAVGLSGFTIPPLVIRPMAGLIGLNLVQVKPLGPPIGMLHYMDFKYDDTLEKRRLKLDKILERIKEKQNGNTNEDTNRNLEYKERNKYI